MSDINRLMTELSKLNREQIIAFLTDPSVISKEQLSKCLGIVKASKPMEEMFNELSLEDPDEEEIIGATVGGAPITMKDEYGPRLGQEEAIQAIAEQVSAPEVDEREKIIFFYNHYAPEKLDILDKILNAIEKNKDSSYKKIKDAYGKNPDEFWEEQHKEEEEFDNFFGLQQKAAKRNMYLTTARMGSRGPQFQAYTFKNGTWSKPAWKSARSILKEKEYSGKPTKKGLMSFLGLKDLFVSSKFGECALPPLRPSSFGYIKRSSFGKCKEDRTYGQLFPLGKYAYVDGLHRGVSSNFSEAFAKSKGLYSKPYTKIPNRWTYNQMQFGEYLPGAFQWENNPEQEAVMASFGASKRTRKPVRKPVSKSAFGAPKRKPVKKSVKKPVRKPVTKRKNAFGAPKRKPVKKPVTKRKTVTKRNLIKKKKTLV